jgi:spore germination cell wall hydrolase CwlJ-like protein
LRSLLAAGLLSVCAVATALSATVSAERATLEKQARLEMARDAELAVELVRHLAAETAGVRNALDAPRLKPARATTAMMSAEGAVSDFFAYDFTTLTLAKIDAQERKCLAQAIYFEARSEPRIGQLAVADVVLNRVDSRFFPNSICEVVFQGSHRRTGCQFSFTCDGSMDARVNLRKWKASEDLAGAILAGLRAPVSRNATHYHANYVSPSWADNLTPTATIGAHKFYQFQSRAAVAAAPAAM